MITDVLKSLLPYVTCGRVVKGFGRGSKQLGCPTANFPEAVVDLLPASFPCGVYYGWASIDNGPYYKMVMSVGYNPQFGNTKKTMETHIMHNFTEDFYGSWLSIAIVGYLRPMGTFKGLDELIEAINNDINEACVQLDLPENSLSSVASNLNCGSHAS